MKQSLVALLALGCLFLPAPSWAESGEKTERKTERKSQFTSWRDLKQSKKLCPSDDAKYFDFVTTNGSEAHLVVVDTMKGDVMFKPMVNEPSTRSTISAVEQCSSMDPIAAVNAGYFNLKDGKSASHICIDGQVCCEPRENRALMENAKLKQFLPQILNRSEVRFFEDAHHHQYVDIQRHENPCDTINSEGITENAGNGFKFVSSVQAGPQLLPKLTAREEAFIRVEPDGKEFDSIGCNKTAARTAFGITKDGHAMILCVSSRGKEEFASGVTLEELAAILDRLGCVKAINFDGGASTTMVVHEKSSKGAKETKDSKDAGAGCSWETVCGRSPQTLVKSILLVLPASAVK